MELTFHLSLPLACFTLLTFVMFTFVGSPCARSILQMINRQNLQVDDQNISHNALKAWKGRKCNFISLKIYPQMEMFWMSRLIGIAYYIPWIVPWFYIFKPRFSCTAFAFSCDSLGLLLTKAYEPLPPGWSREWTQGIHLPLWEPTLQHALWCNEGILLCSPVMPLPSQNF